eukprot:TRINITY_DN2597_c0_g3_i2.p2 TRINITY_DN2597_c0_g3~~TRINITY_DN2597_c0_g3_i2.p2  ORF type:complete len:372 (+),score=14.11 TRINITY_DN2597_c0_g3_i2:91-1206(+)
MKRPQQIRLKLRITIIQPINRGTWWLVEFLRQSRVNLEKIIDQNERIDLDTADLVFVFDYCIKYENGSILNTDRNVSRLKKAYDKLLQTSRWRKFNGQDYLFILAHPVEIWMDTKIGSYYCNFFSESLYIQIESLFSCVQQFQKLDIPYVSTIVPQNYIPIHNRKIFLTFRGECNSLQQIGKRLRKTVIEVIKQQNFPLVDVSCSCKHCKDRKSYADNIYELQRSIFCLILAGDSFSSRRLSDAVMAGCLPVFIGPPFHTFPFRNYVNYASFSVIIHVGNATWYQEQQPAQNRFKSEGDQNWIISVLNVEEIVPKLKEIKLSQLDNKLRQMEKYRGMFEYYPNVHGNVSAVDVIFKHMCGIVKKRKQNRYV